LKHYGQKFVVYDNFEMTHPFYKNYNYNLFWNNSLNYSSFRKIGIKNPLVGHVNPLTLGGNPHEVFDVKAE